MISAITWISFAVIDKMEREINSKVMNLDNLMPLIREQLAKGQSVRFSPKGRSMLPMLRENVDSVVLSPVPEKLKKYDLPLYQRENGKYVLHRIVEAGDTYTCVGDNQFVLERGLHHEQMIAIVNSFERGNRTYRVTDVTYQIYCRVWHYSRRIRHFWRRCIRWIGRKLWIKR